jgi:DNA polymerase IV
MLQRKIIHIDMDAFYASVEQRDDPTLRGKPIAVGGSPGGRGVVMTASYEARKFGVHSAMPSISAQRLCPDLIFVRPRMDAYKTASNCIREIFHEYTDLVEPLSLDEAYLDVTQNKPNIASAIAIAKEIREKIKQVTGLTATAGVSYNKFLAKMASGYKKPDGLNFIPPEKALEFIDQLPIHKFHGIGAKTAERMKALGIHTGAELRAQDQRFLVRNFGKMGTYYHLISQGIDDRRVSPDRPLKSVSVEDTFSDDVDDLQVLDAQIERLAAMLLRRMSRHEESGKTLTLKVKFDDFQQISRSMSLAETFGDESLIAQTGKNLLRKTDAGIRKVRLLGLGISNFDQPKEIEEDGQMLLPFE